MLVRTCGYECQWNRIVAYDRVQKIGIGFLDRFSRQHGQSCAALSLDCRRHRFGKSFNGPQAASVNLPARYQVLGTASHDSFVQIHYYLVVEWRHKTKQTKSFAVTTTSRSSLICSKSFSLSQDVGCQGANKYTSNPGNSVEPRTKKHSSLQPESASASHYCHPVTRWSPKKK